MQTEDPAGQRSGTLTGECPFTLDRPVMRQRWQKLTFLHWRFNAADVQRLLPAGLVAETFDGTAWVGLVPFVMRVATPGDRAVPWVSNFCETNVRTYVRDEAGRSGVWFFSLDAARLGAVGVGRASYRLPYYWSGMRLRQRGDDIQYSCQRRWPGSDRNVTSHLRISVGEPYRPHELGQLDHFLTARWILFSAAGRRRWLGRACHDPWPLARAQVLLVDDQLLDAAGLPPRQGEPLAHYSPGVDVALGRPEAIRL